MNIPVNTIFCIGRNYVAHIAELNNETPTEPMVFFKPNNSLLYNGGTIVLPKFSQNVHYETELVVQIGRDCDEISAEMAYTLISGYAVGLDLTARDVQDVAKQKGLPWAKAKGFRGAACLSNFISSEYLPVYHDIEFSMTLNGQLQQQGKTCHMIYSIPVLLTELVQTYGLKKGDIVFTGTPSGVGQLHSGDVIELNLHQGLVHARFDVK